MVPAAKGQRQALEDRKGSRGPRHLPLGRAVRLETVRSHGRGLAQASGPGACQMSPAIKGCLMLRVRPASKGAPLGG